MTSTHRLNRRQFIHGTAAGVLAVNGASFAADSEMPKRILGRTGEKVSIVGLGTAPVGEGPPSVQEAIDIFSAAIDHGVNYIDTARSYGNAEEALGHIVPAKRDSLFLVTKLWTDNGAEAEKLLNESLKQLKTDAIDLVHIHHLGGKEVEKVLADEGILNYLLKAKQQGKLRFIGLSGHARPPRYLKMLETGKIDVVMPVMNYADRNIYNFEGTVLPECRRQNVGVVAMKVYAGIKGGFKNHRNAAVGCATPDERLPQALAYALDLEGVSSAVIGPYTVEQAIENAMFARAYKPLTEAERADLLAFGETLAEELGPRYGPVA